MDYTNGMDSSFEMNYEYLIRAVFKCGRGGKFGADADIFRGLERTSVKLPGEHSVDLFRQGLKVGEVSTYLSNALDWVKEQHEGDDDFISKIDKCGKNILRISFERLEFKESLACIKDCIKETWEVFNEYGINI